jgi:hypothetical protein
MLPLSAILFSMAYRTVQAQTTHNSLIKPGELIDIKELTPLTLFDRRVFNLLLGNAWERIEEDVEHSIRKKDLRGSHEGSERLDDTIGRLMGARVVVQLERDGKPYSRSVPLLEHLDQPIRGDGKVYYQFPRKLRNLISDSHIFARIEKDVMLALSSKYALALYEVVQKRGNLSHQWTETFDVQRMRELLGVPDDKLKAYKSFKQRALIPAIEEVDGLSSYGVNFIEVKKGRKVEAITLGWHKKSVDELKEAFSELKRHRVGRRARLSGAVELAE